MPLTYDAACESLTAATRPELLGELKRPTVSPPRRRADVVLESPVRPRARIRERRRAVVDPPCASPHKAHRRATRARTLTRAATPVRRRSNLPEAGDRLAPGHDYP